MASKDTKTKEQVAMLGEIEAKVKAVHDKHSGRKSEANRKNLYLYGGGALFFLVLIVFAVANQAWMGILLPLNGLLWLGVAWVQATLIVRQHYTIAVMHDLHDLERDELHEIVDKHLAHAEEQLAKAKA